MERARAYFDQLNHAYTAVHKKQQSLTGLASEIKNLRENQAPAADCSLPSPANRAIGRSRW